MAQTGRIGWTSGAPSTEFVHGADIVAQSQSGNYSVVRVSATAWNRGSSGSYSANQGVHTAAIDGFGQAQYTGTLPSGVPNGGVRWDNTVDIIIPHDSNGYRGNVTLRQSISGWFSWVRTAAFGGFTRIPKRPSVPGTPTFSEITPTSVRVSWSPSTDDGGSAIDHYLLRYWPNATGTGAHVNDSMVNNRSRVVTGLTPGQDYRFAVHSHNGSADNGGYSNQSTAAVVRTLSGMWYKIDGQWKRVVPYVKVAGQWKAASVFIKTANTWKRGG